MAQEFQYAGVLPRFLAFLIDSIILGIIMVPLALLGVFSIGVGVATRGVFDMTGFFVLWAVMIVLNILYFTILEGMHGQTIGKMVLNIKVVGYDGKEIGMARAFVRNLLRIVDGFFFYIVGIVLILATEKHQRLGDMAGSDVVVSLRKGKSFTPEKSA